ncbi:hypothetical protein [Arenibacter arenosicollis]|nr:hypothetical protein [Arenibacter arenosicollis]
MKNRLVLFALLLFAFSLVVQYRPNIIWREFQGIEWVFFVSC